MESDNIVDDYFEQIKNELCEAVKESPPALLPRSPVSTLKHLALLKYAPSEKKIIDSPLPYHYNMINERI